MSQLSDRVKTEFISRFNELPLLVLSPGRINLIGEHLDYNGGLVFPAAIDKEIAVAITESGNDHSSIVALDLNEESHLHLNNLEIAPSGSWKNYVIGIIKQLQNRGFTIPNFNLVFTGNIPLGSGLSSSAALENGIVFGLNEIFKLGLSKLEMIKISQQAEHEAVGVKCGIMDQFASMFGIKHQALVLNCDTLEYESVKVELGEYQLLLINTNVNHQLSDSPYNKRRHQCANGLFVLQKSFSNLKALAHSNLTQLEAIKGQLSPMEIKRCQFVIEEQQRVIEAKFALESKNLERLGELIFLSHEGLRDLYEVSCSELDFLVNLALNNEHVLGARMMGAGFGGCTINLIHDNHVESFLSEVTQRFGAEFGHSPTPIKISLREGTSIVSPH